MNLETKYMGLRLKNPLIVGASPLADDLDKVRALEDAGIAAISLYSLFEEQISHNTIGREVGVGDYSDSFVEAACTVSNPDLCQLDVDTYLGKIQEIKTASSLPVIGSLNGTRRGEWVSYARLIEEAGADALELNLYFLATEVDESASELEDRCVEIVKAVKENLSIPLAVKLSAYFTALPHFANRLVGAGADALVLFNRFYQPDIDLDALDIESRLQLSNSSELLPRLRWLALLRDRVKCDLSVTGGVHSGADIVKSLLAGADTVQLVSSLLKNGPSHLNVLFADLAQWMSEKGFDSLEQFRGSMSYLRCKNPDAFERANYMHILDSGRLPREP